MLKLLLYVPIILRKVSRRSSITNSYNENPLLKLRSLQELALKLTQLSFC